jgi:hypothetical protein
VGAGSPLKQNNVPDVSVRLRRALRRSMVIVIAAVLSPAGVLMLQRCCHVVDLTKNAAAAITM